MKVEEAEQIKDILESYLGVEIRAFNKWYDYELKDMDFKMGLHAAWGVVTATRRGERKSVMPSLAEFLSWI